MRSDIKSSDLFNINSLLHKTEILKVKHSCRTPCSDGYTAEHGLNWLSTIFYAHLRSGFVDVITTAPCLLCSD